MPENNDWLAVNQFTVVEDKHNAPAGHRALRQRPAAGVIELKNAADENATIWAAFNQLQTYKARSRRCSPTTRCWSISDGVAGAHRLARRGPGVVHALAHDRRARRCADRTCRNCRSCSKGVFEKRRFLDLCATSSSSRTTAAAHVVKKMAGYHQFHAVNVAVEETLRAARLRAAPEWQSAGRYESAQQPGGDRATGASAWSGTRRARARA